jgi:glycosyltransferase involved in cell wall biosynthesis
MKALFVSNTDWYLYNYRRALSKLLNAQGFDVTLVTPDGSYVPRLQEEGYRWLCWDVGRKTISPFTEMIAVNRLARIYRHEKPDIVHHFTIKPVLYGSMAARLAGVPRVVNSITGRGYIFLARELKARLLRPLTKELFRITMRGGNCRVIFENEADREFFLIEGLVPLNRTHLIHGVGIDPARFFPAPESGGIPIILFPARMLWDKGLGELVEAARLLQGRVETRIVLVGQPDPGNPTSVSEETLQQWHREGVVEYWGWQSDMTSVYQQSHIVTLPTHYEGAPTVLFEAAACGRPIVASDIPGCRMIVQEGVNGFLTPVGSPGALAEALEILVKDPDLRHRMGEAGRKMVEDHFTDTIVNEKTFETYRLLFE